MKSIFWACGLALLAMPITTAQAHVSLVDPAATEKSDSRDPNQMRCRKFQVTGSLVKKDRICKTNAEWAKITEDMQRNADNLIGRGRTGQDCRANGGAC